MDTLVSTCDRPVYADLDGTVLRSDLLWETLFLYARQKPLEFWRVFGWLLRGKAVLKDELAARVECDVATLPYREEVVEALRRERAAGRRVVLATAASHRLAEPVAAHLGVFDAVMASDRDTNLSAGRKLARIRAETGEVGFDYYGNSRDDVCLFGAAARATVVQPDRHARRWHGSCAGATLLDDRGSRRKAALKTLRPHQWMKNLLIFVPLGLNQEFFDAFMMLQAIVAFVCFSFAASSVYVLNDLLDLSADRRHRTKRNRPLASGALPIPTALALAAGLLGTSFLLALTLPLPFLGALAAYMAATTAYSVALKRFLLIDVLTLAGLYTLRIIAGSAAVGVEESFWLLAFSIFFFLSLALVKRFVELVDFGSGATRSTTGRGYVDADIETIGQAGMASGFASVLVLALYVDSAEVRQLYNHPYIMWLLCPLVLYIIVRIWILARRNQMHEDPVVFILRDWRSQIMIAFGALLFLAAAYV